MIEAVDPTRATAPTVAPVDERAARRTLLDQIGRLEAQLAELASQAWPCGPLAATAPTGRRTRRGPRLLGIGELERVRDELAARVQDGRRQLADRRASEQASRELIADMRRDPASHRWTRVCHHDIGEPGCRDYRVVPRWGIVGALANWWRVKVSSGCP